MLADITGGDSLFCRVDHCLTSRHCQGLFERADADMDSFFVALNAVRTHLFSL